MIVPTASAVTAIQLSLGVATLTLAGARHSTSYMQQRVGMGYKEVLQAIHELAVILW